MIARGDIKKKHKMFNSASNILAILLVLSLFQTAQAQQWERVLDGDSPGVRITEERPSCWFSPTHYSAESPYDITLDNIQYNSLSQVIEYYAEGIANGFYFATHIYDSTYNSLGQVTGFRENRYYPTSGNAYNIEVSGVKYDGFGNVKDGYLVTVSPGSPPAPSGNPNKTTNPNPSNGAKDQPIDINLSWSSGGGETSFDIYFGNDLNLDDSAFRGNQYGTTFNPGILSYGTKYYWRVDAKNSQGSTAGDIWSFTTTKAPALNPLNVSKSVIGAPEGEVMLVGVGNIVTYRICFDGNDIVQPIFNVSIVDILPQEVSFVKADGDGIIRHYDDNTHTYTWSFQFISPGDINRMDLIVKVNEDVALGKTITNIVTIDSEETPPATASVDIVTVEGGGQIGDLEVEDLQIIPSTIRRDNDLTDITAVMKLPEGYEISDVDVTKLLVLYPGNIKAREQLVTETEGRTVITAVFDKAALLDAISGYGQFNLEVIGKLISGQSFYGQATITITEAEDISDYISSMNIKINQIWDYNDPTDSTDLMYEFQLEIEALVDPAFAAFNVEAHVEGIDFLTPAGYTFQIPKLPGQWSDGIWTSYKYDPELNMARWEYRARSTSLDDLRAYGDGEYTITVHYLIDSLIPPISSNDQITVWFGIPGTQDPIPQPIQEPVLISPLYNQAATSPVIFMWEPCKDKNTTEISINVDEHRTDGDKEDILDKNKTRWGPVYLTDGLWEARLAFGQWASSSENKISVDVGKYSQSKSEFIVIGQPSNRYEVWGGETFVGMDEPGKFLSGGFGDIDQLEAYGYIKLGEAEGQTATFTGKYKHYLIATKGQFLLDSIQGSDGSHYSSFKESFELSNVTQPDNLLGPPDGKYATIGESNPWADFTGYFAFTNHDNWTGFTVKTINLNLSKSIVGTVYEIENIDPNDKITYKICFDSNDLVDAITDVSIVDILPDEVSFISAQSNEISGVYDPDMHTYTWFYPSLAPKSAIEMQLTVQVNPDAAPGSTITNFVYINSNEMPPATANIKIVTSEIPPPIGDLSGDLQIYPSTIRRNGAQVNLKAVLQLPEDTNIEVSDISDEPAALSILSPENFEGNIKARTQLPVETSDGIIFIAWFDVNELMSAIPGYYGELDVAVEGKFTSDQEFQEFYGITKITISRFGGN